MVVQTRIADYLRTQRKELKLTAVAEMAHIKYPRFSALINNHAEMKADEFSAICLALNVEPNKFILSEKTKKGGDHV